MNFDHHYFKTWYADYFRQNSLRKLDFYLQLLRQQHVSGWLLDLGCSYGLFVHHAIPHFRTIGMDVVFEVVAAARARTPQGVFLVGRAPHLPFRNLDAITALDVLEHLHDLDQTLAAICGALSPRGICLIVVPVYDGPLGLLVRWLDRDPTHLHRCSRSFWLEHIGRYFAIQEWQGIFRKLVGGQFYFHLPSRRLRAVAPAIAVVCRAPRLDYPMAPEPRRQSLSPRDYPQ